MGVNKMRPHAVVIPEDEANVQLVNGFVQHYAVNSRQLGVESPAGGWEPVLTLFETEYVRYLRNYPAGHVVLLLDFDDQGESRRARCEERIPDDLKSRVFLLGTGDEPEALAAEASLKLEQIGLALAQDCDRNELATWSHPHLAHNLPELARLLPLLKPILFTGA